MKEIDKKTSKIRTLKTINGDEKSQASFSVAIKAKPTPPQESKKSEKKK